MFRSAKSVMKNSLVFFFLSLMLLAPVGVKAQGKWILWGSYSRSLLVLGSADSRTGYSLGLQYAVPERRLRWGKMPGQLVFEGYVLLTRGGGLFEFPPDRTYALGGLFLLRYERPWFQRTHFFFEAGWGLQYANHVTHDLDSKLNSTPTIGLGASTPLGDKELYFGLRLLHISNGGTKGGNEGQNVLQLMMGYRF